MTTADPRPAAPTSRLGHAPQHGIQHRAPASARSPTGPAVVPPRGAGWMLSAALHGLFSFEALFALFLYSNTLKYFFPKFPIDETVVLLSLCVIVFVALIWQHGLYRPGLSLVLASLTFFGWLTLSMLWSPGRTLALQAVGYNLTFNIFCLCVGALLLAGDPRRIRRFFTCVLAIGTILSVHGLWIYAQYGTFRFYRGFEGILAYLLWGFPVATASAISLGFAFAAPPGTARQLSGAILSVLFAVFLLIASGRAPMLSYALCLAVPIVLVAPRIVDNRLFVSRIQLMAGLAFLALIVYIGYALYQGNVPYTIQRFLDLWGYIEYGGTAVRFQRLSYWMSALEYWSRSPLIGIGIGGFSSLYLSGRELAGTQPHNILLEILTELGIVGLILFGLVLWVALRSVDIERLRRDPLFLGSFLMFVGLFGVRAMTSTDLAFQWELFVSLGLLTAAPAATSTAGQEQWPTPSTGETIGRR
ncbi:MAG: O-antigen ligase family protein [Geminicoccaceae bacterium]|nr:O-antigen ligase family protein [Geminicoccaceae bacterium]